MANFLLIRLYLYRSLPLPIESLIRGLDDGPESPDTPSILIQ